MLCDLLRVGSVCTTELVEVARKPTMTRPISGPRLTGLASTGLYSAALAVTAAPRPRTTRSPIRRCMLIPGARFWGPDVGLCYCESATEHMTFRRFRQRPHIPWRHFTFIYALTIVYPRLRPLAPALWIMFPHELKSVRSPQMKSPRVLVRPCLLAAGLLLTYPLTSLAAPEGDSNGPCNRPEPHDFHAPPPPGPGPGREMGPEFGFGPGMGPGLGVPPPFLHGLHLTDEQQDKVFAIVYAAAPALREQSKALRKAHEALRDINQSPQYDENRVKGLAETAAKADSQLTVLRVRTEHEIYAVLTPEQKKKLEERRRGH